MKILLFGGAFDPPHAGHVKMLTAAVKSENFDMIIVMPTGEPGHKSSCKAPFHIRSHFARETFSPIDENIVISDYEYRKQGKSYSFETVDHLKDKYPGASVYFLIGGDSAITLNEWKNRQHLAENATFLIYPRKECIDEKLLKAVDKIKKISEHSMILSGVPVEISSTEIRNMAEKNLDISAFTRESVAKEIKEYSVYSNDEYQKNVGCAKFLISILLNEKRSVHTYNVARLAKELAEIHGVDSRKAYLAGLLHDIMKQTDEANIKRLYRRGQTEQPPRKRPLPVLHGFARAQYVKKEMGITDSDLLWALRSHTCGRRGMSDLEKVVYLADMLSYEREYPEKDKLLNFAKKNLNTAMEAALSDSIDWVRQKGGTLDRDSVSALEYFKKINRGNS
jgi:nicotinate-nucleotide adenylyltransferase